MICKEGTILCIGDEFTKGKIKSWIKEKGYNPQDIKITREEEQIVVRAKIDIEWKS